MAKGQQRRGSGDERLPRGYETMMQRARSLLERARGEGAPSVEQSIDQAKERAVALGELTAEEAERVGEYVRRDLKHAGDYLSRTGAALADWLCFDHDLLEAQLRDALSVMADRTRLEWQRLAEAADERHTGEIVGPGTLQCVACGETLRFQTAGHVPPCPRCHGSVFRRVSR